MKNKINEANGYNCVLCETGKGDKHGLLCSENKNSLINILDSLSAFIFGYEFDKCICKNPHCEAHEKHILDKIEELKKGLQYN